MKKFSKKFLIFGVLSGILLTYSFVSFGEEETWSGMIIVDKSSSLHAEGAREKPALASPIIIHVDESSNAFKDGLRSGDYILGTADKIILSVSELESVLKKPVPLKVQTASGLRVVAYTPSPVTPSIKAYLRIKEILREKKVNEYRNEILKLVEENSKSPIVNFIAGFAFGSIKDKTNANKFLEAAALHAPDSILAKISRKRLPKESIIRIDEELAKRPPAQGANSVNLDPPKMTASPGATIILPSPEMTDFAQEPSQTEPQSGKLADGLDPKTFFAASIDERIEMMRAVLPRNPNDKDLRHALSGYLLKKVMKMPNAPYEELEPLLREALELTPEPFFAHYIWGNVLYARKNYNEAIIHYEEAHKISPEDPNVNMKLGFSYAFVMKYEEAIPFLEKAHQAAPKEFFILYYLGVCHFETKDYEKAIEYLELALNSTQHPGNIDAVNQLLRKAKEYNASVAGSTTDENQRFIVQFAGDSQKDIGDTVMEILEEAYDQVTSDLMYKPDIKIHVLFFRTKDFYEMNKTPQWAGALAAGAKILVPLREGYNMNNIKGILAHEFTHVIVNLRTNQRCPTWIHEGLAVYQEQKMTFGDPNIMRPDYEKAFRETIQTDGRLIPLNQIQLDYQTQKADITLGYVESYLAIRFLIDKWGFQAIDQILSSIGQGNDWTQALEEAVDRDINTFQKEFADWLQGIQ